MDIINTVKEEILRLAEKQSAVQVGQARKAVLQYRKQVVELRRLLSQREKEIRLLKKRTEQSPIEDDELDGIRFSAKSVRSQRRRLGLTCEQYGRLIGVSPLTISNWENQKARPRRAQLLALIVVRGIAKREAMLKLEQ